MSRITFPAMSITIPDNWHEETLTTFRGPADDNFMPNLIITRIRRQSGETVQAHAQRQIQSLTELPADLEFSLIEQGEALLSGQAAWFVTFRVTAPDNPPVVQRHYYVEVGDWNYCFSASSLESEAGGMAAVFDAITQSLKFGLMPE